MKKLSCRFLFSNADFPIYQRIELMKTKCLKFVQLVDVQTITNETN
jgi:hypothetical protein